MDDLIPAIDRYGWAVQLVTDDGPGHPAFGYTVGLAHRLPELLAIGVADPHAAGQLLNEVATQLRARPWLAQVGQPLAMPDGAPWPTVRLGAVAPIWARRYALRAFAYHDLDDPNALPVLQVLVPDEAGRFPDDPAVDPDRLDAQPVLADADRPWLLPHGTRRCGLLLDDPPVSAAALLLLPILAPDGPAGRDELVAADHLDDGTWRVASQPTLADWCAVGATVHAAPVTEPVRGAEDAEVVRYLDVERESAMIPLRWELLTTDLGVRRRLKDIVAQPRFDDAVVLGTSALPHSLTVAVPPRHAQPLRLAVRRLERDGLVRARELFHRREDADLAPPDPRCPACRRGPTERSYP